MERVVVLGSSCSGKSTLARRLAAILKAEYIEIDALNWQPQWQERPHDELRALIAEAVVQPRWVCDGNYSRQRDLIWPRATTLVWLNYSFPIVFSRALRRSFRRIIRKEEVCGGNYETFTNTFLSHDSILLWILITYRRRRTQYRAIFDGEAYEALEKIEFRHPREAARFLDAVRDEARVDG